MEKLFNLYEILSTHNLGWGYEQNGGSRYIFVEPIPLANQNITRVGILVGKSWNGIPTGSSPNPGILDSNETPM